MDITYKVISVNGLNAIVEYKCGEAVVQVGLELSADATPDELAAEISAQKPVEALKRILNKDALTHLVGSEGKVVEPVDMAKEIAVTPTSDKIITFKDAP